MVLSLPAWRAPVRAHRAAVRARASPRACWRRTGWRSRSGCPACRDQCIAEARLGAIAHGCDIAQAHRQPAARAEHRLRQRIERGAGACAWITMRCVGVSSSRRRSRRWRALAVAKTSSSVKAAAASLNGSTAIWRSRTSPPKICACATPGTARICGLTIHCTRSRNCDGRQAIAGVAEVHQVLHRGAQRREQRRADALRQAGRELGQAFGDHLALAVRIAAAVEHHLDRREPLTRGRAHRLDILGAGQQSLQRTRHQRFDLRRVEAGRLGLHEHVRRREIRKYVEARRDQRGQRRARRSGRRAR
jgi:hypothetical protein